MPTGWNAFAPVKRADIANKNGDETVIGSAYILRGIEMGSLYGLTVQNC